MVSYNDAEREGVGIISYYEEAFPQILRETINEDGNADAPLILFYRGNIKVLQMPGIAIIGTREPTEAGTQAGLSYATIVIQTGLRGGTMHAVNATLKARKPLFMIKYKNMDGQVGGKAEGNKKFLEDGKAHALTSGSFEDALAVIRESVEKNNKPQIKDSLF